MNTRNKRASALGIGLAALVVLPAPDSAITISDRQQTAFSYAGISTAIVVYDFIEFTDETLTSGTFASETLTTGTFASETLEPS